MIFKRFNLSPRHLCLTALIFLALLACGSASPSLARSTPSHSGNTLTRSRSVHRNSHKAQAASSSAGSIQYDSYPPAATELASHDLHIMAMCTDQQKRTWLGTEEEGIYCYDPAKDAASRWTHYTTADGLGDDTAYTLCCDRLGRIWAGHDRSGVSVFNGKAWKNYDTVTGPLGSHVYAMCVSPVSSDIWMATEAGLSRYSLAHDNWQYYIAPGGVSLTQATCLAFNKRGDLLVGTQDDGIDIGRASSGFTAWSNVSGPSRPPEGAGGSGLPSRQINCLLTTRSGQVWVGTHDGLAHSEDGGTSWRFVRGADYADKVIERRFPFTLPSASSSPSATLMTEDYVTCLAAGKSGSIYVGHWKTGVEAYNRAAGTFHALPFASSNTVDFVASLLPLTDGGMLVGTYAHGINMTGPPREMPRMNPLDSDAAAIAGDPLPYPAEAKPPTLQKLRDVLTALKRSASPALKPGTAAYLSADWCTRGDWVGRYGSRYAVLCAADSPLNTEFINDYSYTTDPFIGSHSVPDDGVRRWIEWLSIKDPRVLWDPAVGTRREAEWDDHGEAYQEAQKGPDLWVTLTVPAGVHRLSAYFVNKDGSQDENRIRDYLAEIVPYRAAIAEADKLQPLAVARVRQNWDGVYESFALCGPGKFYLKVDRNNSFNTMVSGIMFDKISGPPTPYENDFKNVRSVYFATPLYAAYVAPPKEVGLPRKPVSGTSSDKELAAAIWSRLDSAPERPGWSPSVESIRLLCYRAFAKPSQGGASSSGKAQPGADGDAVLLAWLRRAMPYETDEDRAAFSKAMDAQWADEKRICPMLADGNT